MHKHTHQEVISPTQVLRAKGFRVTTGKVKLLEFMKDSGKPVTVQNIFSSWTGKKPNETTLYRSLTDLCRAGIVKRLDLNTGIAHFEYTTDRPHHHHVICLGCGVIEEIEHCAVGELQKKIIKESVMFTDIDSHNLEFFGHCVGCCQ